MVRLFYCILRFVGKQFAGSPFPDPGDRAPINRYFNGFECTAYFSNSPYS